MLAAEEHAAEVDVHQLFELGERGELNRCSRQSDARVVHEDIDPPHLRMRRADDGVECVHIRHIRDMGQHPAFEQSGRGIERGRILIGVLGHPYKCPPAPFEGEPVLPDGMKIGTPVVVLHDEYGSGTVTGTLATHEAKRDPRAAAADAGNEAMQDGFRGLPVFVVPGVGPGIIGRVDALPHPFDVMTRHLHIAQRLVVAQVVAGST